MSTLTVTLLVPLLVVQKQKVKINRTLEIDVAIFIIFQFPRFEIKIFIEV